MDIKKAGFLSLIFILFCYIATSCSDDEGDYTKAGGFDYSTKNLSAYENKYAATDAEGKFNADFWLERDSIAGYNKLESILSIDIVESEFYFSFKEKENSVKTINLTLSLGDADGTDFTIATDQSTKVDLSNPEYKKLIYEYINDIFKDQSAKLSIECIMLDLSGNPVPSVEFHAGVKAALNIHARWIGDRDK